MANAWREYENNLRIFPFKEVLRQRREAGEVNLTMKELVYEEMMRQREEMLRKKGMTWEEFQESEDYMEVFREGMRRFSMSPCALPGDRRLKWGPDGTLVECDPDEETEQT